MDSYDHCPFSLVNLLPFVWTGLEKSTPPPLAEAGGGEEALIINKIDPQVSLLSPSLISWADASVVVGWGSSSTAQQWHGQCPWQPY